MGPAIPRERHWGFTTRNVCHQVVVVFGSFGRREIGGRQLCDGARLRAVIAHAIPMPGLDLTNAVCWLAAVGPSAVCAWLRGIVAQVGRSVGHLQLLSD